jgi:hypothetical protein
VLLEQLEVGLVEILPMVEEDEIERALQLGDLLARRADAHVDPLSEARGRNVVTRGLGVRRADLHRHQGSGRGEALTDHDRRVAAVGPELEDARTLRDASDHLAQEWPLLGSHAHEPPLLGRVAVEGGEHAGGVSRRRMPGDVVARAERARRCAPQLVDQEVEDVAGVERPHPGVEESPGEHASR